MAVSSDVTIAQNGGQGNVKPHPYLVAFVRWCVSCVWSSATLLVHRLLFAPLPITRPSVSSVRKPMKRPATHEHLHPEPLVECSVLHAPADHGVDVVFVHGLYGSLGNTWRQGEWKTKYKSPPFKTTLLRPEAILKPCQHDAKNKNAKPSHSSKHVANTASTFSNDRLTTTNERFRMFENDKQLQNNVKDIIDNYSCDNTDALFNNLKDKFYKDLKTVIPNEVMFTTENFYNNAMYEYVEVVDNFETQADFVKDLFINENSKCCDNNCDDRNDFNKNVERKNDCVCVYGCEVGCGCVCDDCYSPCWPRDWIKEDYPDARVISINYTSDPYLWRPLWKKECKRLRLHERAEQMSRQLIKLGVGKRPIIWVGHSKGGLFIKQIYCEAYEAHLKMINIRKNRNINAIKLNQESDIVGNSECMKQIRNNAFCNNLDLENGNKFDENDGRTSFADNEKTTSIVRDNCNLENENDLRNDVETNRENRDDEEIPNDEDVSQLAKLWASSAGFMLYSVPHRGSSLADIKTPITARSVELMEMCKDNSLVLDLHSRWMTALNGGQAVVDVVSSSTNGGSEVDGGSSSVHGGSSLVDGGSPLVDGGSPLVDGGSPLVDGGSSLVDGGLPVDRRKPVVASLVETCRTLMSVLWLQIVSVNSADAGIGPLCGVNVDHREICKPSSRKCILYKELMDLMHAALGRCRCQ